MTEPKKAAAKAIEPPAKPGDKGFDWQSEYPGEDVFVYTSSEGVTVGLARMSSERAPGPGRQREVRA